MQKRRNEIIRNVTREQVNIVKIIQQKNIIKEMAVKNIATIEKEDGRRLRNESGESMETRKSLRK